MWNWKFARQHLEFRRSLLTLQEDCEPADPANTVTDRLNTLLNTSGPGYVLHLCPGEQYPIQAPILFAFSDQEISTAGYPSGDERATLVVNGPVADGMGHTTAVDGTCSTCSRVKLRNVQINGARGGAPPTSGGANIEMGGSNSDQLVEYVRSFDPRSWSCLHIAEGALSCNNVVVQNNDIGPCGVDAFQQWADGISVSCSKAIVRNNMINNPTDGGIVLFGSPGTQVYNNTIWVQNQTLLGGINMVDYLPWSGNYTGTVVTNNTILGGFATSTEEGSETDGPNNDDVIVKIGIAIGPRTWFGDRYGDNASVSGTVTDNRFSGAFSYAIAVSSASNFTVQNNVLFGGHSFIGARGPNCSASDVLPAPAAFIVDPNTTMSSSLQADFVIVADGNSLNCVQPPGGGDYWPFGGNPSSPEIVNSASSVAHSSPAGIALGVVFGILAIALTAWFLRKWALTRAETIRLYRESKFQYMSSSPKVPRPQ